MESLGFTPSQVLTFGSARGSNSLAGVERLHVIGRPMPPGDELVYLAQVLNPGREPVSSQLELRRVQYGGQRYGVDVVDFADPRVSNLLHASREDELAQVLHRARLVTLDPQEHMTGFDSNKRRHRVRLVLHTNQPVPGLRVDQLIVGSVEEDVNEARRREAESRINAAVERLQQRGEEATVTAVAKEAGAHKATVSRIMGQRCIPLNHNLYKGMNRCPQISDDASESQVGAGFSLSPHPLTIVRGDNDAQHQRYPGHALAHRRPAPRPREPQAHFR